MRLVKFNDAEASNESDIFLKEKAFYNIYFHKSEAENSRFIIDNNDDFINGIKKIKRKRSLKNLKILMSITIFFVVIIFALNFFVEMNLIKSLCFFFVMLVGYVFLLGINIEYSDETIKKILKFLWCNLDDESKTIIKEKLDNGYKMTLTHPVKSPKIYFEHENEYDSTSFGVVLMDIQINH